MRSSPGLARSAPLTGWAVTRCMIVRFVDTNVLLGLTAGVDPGTTAEAIATLQDAGVSVTPA